MSHRLFFTYNRPANVDNHYVVGSGVGSKSRFVRSALRRRSNNNAQGKPCCFPMSNSIQSNSIHSTPPLDSIEELPTYGDENNLWCDQSFSPYSVGDTSMCCWTDDYNASPQGCKDINSVCYTGPNEGLLKTCPNNNMIDCSNVLWGCGKNNECRPDLSGEYQTYNLCISGCSSPPPPSPSGLPDVKKVIYFNTGKNPDFSSKGDLDIAIDKGYNILILGFLLTKAKDTFTNVCTLPDCSPDYSPTVPATSPQCSDAKPACWTDVSGTYLYTANNFSTKWWQKLPWNDYNPDTGGNNSSGGLQSKDYQSTVSDRIKNKGAFLFFSAGGWSENPWQVYSNGSDYGRDVAKFVSDNQLHGIDFDLENVTAAQETWIIDATTAAYDHFQTIPGKTFYISHAPQPAFFTGGPYTNIYKECSNSIDFLNVQFYNQGTSNPYEDASSLLYDIDGAPSYTSLHELYGIPNEKIVIGKPGRMQPPPPDATIGYVTDASLNSWYIDYQKSHGIIPSTMIWQYHKDNIYDMNRVYKNLK